MATDVVKRTESEIDGRRQINSVSEFMIKYVPGFENAFVSVTNAEIGVRETRHIEGMYTLTGMDVYEGRKFEDVVSRGYFRSIFIILMEKKDMEMVEYGKFRKILTIFRTDV